MHFLIQDHLTKDGVFNKSILGTLKRQMQTISNVRSKLFSERLCTTIATDILSIGKWHYIACDQPIEMPYVICEKTRTNISLLRKTIQPVVRGSHECHYNEVLYVYKNQHKCLSLKWKCLAPDLIEDVLFRDEHDIGHFNYLGRWAMGLTSTIGYLHINETHGLCFNEIQKWRYHHRSHWEKGNICLLHQTQYWRCVTNTNIISQLCKATEFQCKDKVCILNQYRCDNIIDCLDGSDEANCTNVCTDGFDCFLNCKDHACRCSFNYIPYGNRCEPVYWRYHELLSISNSNVDRVSEVQQYIFNSDISCRGEWALCTSGDTGSCYPNQDICVFERNIFGTPLYCNNTEHLNGCYEHQCATHFKCRGTFCIPIYMLCDGVVDCPDKEDETQILCRYIIFINT